MTNPHPTLGASRRASLLRPGPLALACGLISAFACPVAAHSPESVVAPDVGAPHGTWSVVRTVPPRLQTPAVFDAARRLMIIADGSAEVWVLRTAPGEERWSRMEALGTPPLGVLGQAAAFDPIGDRILQFGGRRPSQANSELWELTLGDAPTWRRLTPLGGSPPARMWGTLVHDVLRHRMLLFGGWTQDGGLWALSLTGTPTWSFVPVQGTPPPAGLPYRLVHEPDRDRLYVLGGNGGNQLWSVDLADPTWRQVTPVGLPAASDGWGFLCLDPAGSRLVALQSSYYGGGDQVWSFSLENESWSSHPITAWPPPLPRQAFSAVQDPGTGRVFLHAGRSERGESNDTWELRLDSMTWRELELAPLGRTDHAMAWDPGRDRLLVTGGVTGWGNSFYPTVFFDPRLWEFTSEGEGNWAVSARPEAMHRTGVAAAYDEARDRLLTAGGFTLHYPGCHPSHDSMIPSYPGDAWSLATTADASDARLPSGGHSEGHALVLDGTRDRLFSFGGVRVEYVACDHVAQTQRVYGNALQVLDLRAPTTWATIGAEGEPPPRQTEAILVHDEDRDRLVLVGGQADWNWLRGRIWTLDLREAARWQHVAVDGTAPARELSAIYDPVRERIVAYDISYQGTGVWALELDQAPRWEPLVPPGTLPGMKSGARVAYDEANDRMVLFGGLSQSGLMADVWFLTWGDPLLRVGLLPHPAGMGSGLAASRAGHSRLAVLGTATFDPRTIDPATLVVTGGALARHGNGTPVLQGVDVNHDGHVDLVLHVGLDAGAGMEDIFFRLDARTLAGRLVRGTAWVAPLPDRGPLELHASEAALEFAIAGVTPNPVRGGRLVLGVTTPSGAPIEIALFDVSGRRVRDRSIAALAPGRHELELDAAGVASGIYFVRVRQEGRSAVRRVTVIP